MKMSLKNELQSLEESELTDQELFSFYHKEDLDLEHLDTPTYSYWKTVFRVFFAKKSNLILLALLGVILVFTYLYPLLTDYDPFANLLGSDIKHLSPRQAIEKLGFHIKYIFGTGKAGESTFDAVWYGARISMSLALVAAAVNMTVGVVLGSLWGFSRRVDAVMTEVYNIISNVPYILFVSVMVMIFSGSFWTMVLALTVTGWLGIAYFIRTQVVIIREREYNLASRALGTPVWRIAAKNILPFMTGIIVTLAASEIPAYISYEVFLSYIGMGLSERSLGRLIYEAESAMITPGWQFEFWSPVAVVSAVAVVLYVVGQNLGDASDPRTHM